MQEAKKKNNSSVLEFWLKVQPVQGDTQLKLLAVQFMSVTNIKTASAAAGGLTGGQTASPNSILKTGVL